MNTDELFSLTYEQKVKYRKAIKEGYFDDFENSPFAWRQTFLGAFIWKYPQRLNVIRTFERIIGHKPEWKDITEQNLALLVSELRDSNLAPSSVRTMASELKAILNANRKQIDMHRDDFTPILSLKKTTSQHTYLTREEMQRFIDYKPVGFIEEFAHRAFVIEMLTGARFCDACQLTMANCDINTNTISYVPQKTPGIIVRVPVDERMPLRRFLARKPRKTFERNDVNRMLPRICQRLGFDSEETLRQRNKNVTGPKWQFVTTHTARRSFATNLYLAGISIEDIALMMGHGVNIETTKRYICAERGISPTVRAYFQPVFTEPVKIPQNLDDMYEEEPQYAFRT